MKAFFFKCIMTVLHTLGPWPVRFIAWWISSGYLVFVPNRRRASVELYRAIFPGRSRLFHLLCAWRQFHSLAESFSDRLLMGKEGGLTLTSKGRSHIREAARSGRGGIIISSHLGNYEIAASALHDLGFKLMIMMGERAARRVARQQREDLKAKGISIAVASSREGSPLLGLEAMKFLSQGGFVSIAGDIVWTDQRSLVPVRLFGHEARFTSAPHLLALTSGAPLLAVFTARTGKARHRLVVCSLGRVKAGSRAERNAAVKASVQGYADALERAVRRYPFQWYIFEPIFGPPMQEKKETRGRGTSPPAV
jgi:predicted LPLAT superfamily acyltransferase